MRKRIYVPQRIDSMETQLAVETLAYAFEKNEVCSQKKAVERICQLLDWMCDDKKENEARNDALRYVNDKDMAALGWVKLPKGADEVPIQVGDLLSDGCNKPVLVEALELDEDCWAIVTSDGHVFRNLDTFTHRKLTLEDILSEFSDKVLNSGHQWGLDAENTIGEFAMRIRQMMNDEED